MQHVDLMIMLGRRGSMCSESMCSANGVPAKLAADTLYTHSHQLLFVIFHTEMSLKSTPMCNKKADNLNLLRLHTNVNPKRRICYVELLKNRLVTRL